MINVFENKYYNNRKTVKSNSNKTFKYTKNISMIKS